jgi:TolB protein
VIRTRRAGETAPLPARLAMVDRDGHPVLPEQGQARFDPQNGVIYAYSPGVTTVEVPPGEVRITATHGFAAPAASARHRVSAGETATVDLEIAPLWDPSSEGWYSGDLHFHLDWGGTYRLVPEDLVAIAQAEDLEVITPLAASLDVRIKDLPWWDWKRLGYGPPLIVFGQEVRPHLLGHAGFIGTTSRFWPNYWGPAYPIYRFADIPKSDVHAHAHRQGGVSVYVHPVSIEDPFPEGADPTGIPLELVPDAVLGDLDALEVVCLWSDAIGTSEVWYRLLNLGANVVPTGGSDALVDWYRSMSVGSDRVYAHVEGDLIFESFLEAVRAGRTFVTTGPLMKFTVDEEEPGGVVQGSPGDEIEWALTVWSPAPVETIEVLMNGDIVWRGEGLAEAGQKSRHGRVKAPAGGWIAARVYGGPTIWPVMDGIPFAHSGPIWFHEIGSTDKDATRKAAKDLLRWMDVAENRLNERYGDAPIPRIRKRFTDARKKLEQVAQ